MKDKLKYNKQGNLICRRGFVVTSDTVNKHCHDCKFKPVIDDSPVLPDEEACLLANACSVAIGKVNQIVRRPLALR